MESKEAEYILVDSAMDSEDENDALIKIIMNKINHESPILLQIMKGEYYEYTLEILSMCC